MNRIALVLFLSAFTAAAGAQTASKTATTGSSTPKSSSATASTAKTAKAAAPEPWVKLPPGVPRVVHGPVKAPFALHYEDVKVGTGAAGEAGKLWHIKYTGWRAADGVKFDSWDDHKQPVMGKDGKPELGPDGKPKMGDPQPMAFPQGVGRVIPGFDYGLDGMKIGGKRRLFIPWELAYGTRAMPDRPDHPGIPAKSDLIFDVELVDTTDMPQPMARPGMRPGPGAVPPHPGASTQPNAAPSAPGAPATQATPAQSTKPATPATAPTTAPATTTQPSTPSQPQQK
jgi:peptidylprolyl isomerase